jgi:hypothetical protein
MSANWRELSQQYWSTAMWWYSLSRVLPPPRENSDRLRKSQITASRLRQSPRLTGVQA